MDRKTDMGHQKSKTQTGVRQTLTTTIKRQFLAEIVEGTKLIEYREIKPYWTKKFRKISVPFNLRLINGMSKTAPEVTVLITTIKKERSGNCTQAGFWLTRIGRLRCPQLAKVAELTNTFGKNFGIPGQTMDMNHLFGLVGYAEQPFGNFNSNQYQDLCK